MVNSNKIKRMSQGYKRLLAVTIRSEMESFNSDENFVCSDTLKMLLQKNGSIVGQHVVDRLALTEILELLEA